MLLFVHEILPPVEEGARECGAMSDSDASFDDYYASDDSDAMSGSDAEEYLVLDDETFGDVAAGGDETPVVAFRSHDAAEVRGVDRVEWPVRRRRRPAQHGGELPEHHGAVTVTCACASSMSSRPSPAGRASSKDPPQRGSTRTLASGTRFG